MVLLDENVPNPPDGFVAPNALDTLLPPNIEVVLFEGTVVEVGVPNSVLLEFAPPKILVPVADVAPNTFFVDASVDGVEPRPLKNPPPPPNILPPLVVAVDFISVFPPKIDAVVDISTPP